MVWVGVNYYIVLVFRKKYVPLIPKWLLKFVSLFLFFTALGCCKELPIIDRCTILFWYFKETLHNSSFPETGVPLSCFLFYLWMAIVFFKHRLLKRGWVRYLNLVYEEVRSIHCHLDCQETETDKTVKLKMYLNNINRNRYLI